MKCKNCIECIEQMKKKIMETSIENCEEREWLEKSMDSYNDPHYRITLLVLQGSPDRGCILINNSGKWVKAIDSSGKVLGTAKWY